MNHIKGAFSSPRTPQIDGKPFTLQNGRVLHVTVHTLLGEGNAEVSVSGHKFIAKLEAPMEAGERYWVQVKQTENGISLQLIQNKVPKSDESVKNIANDLLNQLSLSNKGKDMQALVIELIKNKVPIHKDMLLFANKYLQQDSSTDQMKVLVELAKNNLPLSDRVFMSLREGKSKDTFVNLLDDLRSKLTSNDSEALEIIKKIQQPLNRVASENTAIKSLATLLNSTATFANRLAGFDLLKSFGIIPQQAPMNAWREGVTNAIVHQFSSNNITGSTLESFSKWLQMNASNFDVQLYSNNGEKVNETQFRKVISMILGDQFVNNKGKSESSFIDLAEKLFSLFGEAKKNTVEMNFSRLLTKWMGRVPDSNEAKLFQQLQLQVNEDLATLIKGEDFGKSLKNMLRSFGLNFEAQLNKNADLTGFQNTLKQQLLQLSNEHPLLEVRELADKMVLKMNSQILQSQDNSPFLNIIQQFPMYLFGKNTDITIQWMGKEKEKGVIDEDFCRILFYLNLDNLNETLVDMQVQNRVISVSIWNDNQDIKEVSQPLIPGLKQGLEQVGYHLSTVNIKIPDKRKNLSNLMVTDNSSTTYTGVDLKI
ncbi:hypothetical protein [Rossellomorea aquimaris]|uniref:hypothetical protein n=1 Tax=Rossellomorea aquimaris TaxID=189382 RepID=UPI0007D063D5|nr:hypothetical protein [Rossellomorea aquimaris]